VKPKTRKTARITLAVKPETRRMIDYIADNQSRSITGVFENLIKIEYHKILERKND